MKRKQIGGNTNRLQVAVLSTGYLTIVESISLAGRRMPVRCRLGNASRALVRSHATWLDATEWLNLRDDLYSRQEHSYSFLPSLFSTSLLNQMANAYQVKIAARLRPPIPGEITDDGVQVEHRDNGTSCISVPNPRDITQIFKFPYVAYIHVIYPFLSTTLLALPLAMIPTLPRKRFLRMMYVL